MNLSSFLLVNICATSCAHLQICDQNMWCVLQLNVTCHGRYFKTGGQLHKTNLIYQPYIELRGRTEFRDSYANIKSKGHILNLICKWYWCSAITNVVDSFCRDCNIA